MEYLFFSLQTKMLPIIFGQYKKILVLKLLDVNLFCHWSDLTGKRKYFLWSLVAVHSISVQIFEGGKLYLKFNITWRKHRFKESAVNSKNILCNRRIQCDPEKPCRRLLDTWDLCALLASTSFLDHDTFYIQKYKSLNLNNSFWEVVDQFPT